MGSSELELIYAMKSLNYYLKTDETANIATAYSNLASYYGNQKDYSKALDYFNKSLEYDSSDPITYNNIANIYNNLKQFDKSEANLLIAISKAETLGDISLLCSLKSNLGVLKYFSGDYVFSQKTLLEANSICSKLNILDSVANSYIYLGFVSIELNDLVSANQYYNKVKPLVEQIGDQGISYDLSSLKSKLNK